MLFIICIRFLFRGSTRLSTNALREDKISETLKEDSLAYSSKLEACPRSGVMYVVINSSGESKIVTLGPRNNALNVFKEEVADIIYTPSYG